VEEPDKAPFSDDKVDPANIPTDPSRFASESDHMTRFPLLVLRVTAELVVAFWVAETLSIFERPVTVTFPPIAALPPVAVNMELSKVWIVALVLMDAQLTVSAPAKVIAPFAFEKAPAPAHVKVKLLVELLESPVDTTMLPALSIVMFLAVIADTKSSARMLVAVAPLASKTPSMNWPAVVPELVTVTEVATNVGVTVSEVPTKASAVTVRVWAEPPTPDWNPIFENVATPSREVVVVDVMFVVTPPIVC
jgi:hypothetical protein